MLHPALELYQDTRKIGNEENDKPFGAGYKMKSSLLPLPRPEHVPSSGWARGSGQVFSPHFTGEDHPGAGLLCEESISFSPLPPPCCHGTAFGGAFWGCYLHSCGLLNCTWGPGKLKCVPKASAWFTVQHKISKSRRGLIIMMMKLVSQSFLRSVHFPPLSTYVPAPRPSIVHTLPHLILPSSPGRWVQQLLPFDRWGNKA